MTPTQSLRVTQSDGVRVQEFILTDRGRKTRVKMFHDMSGYLSSLEIEGKRLSLSELLPLLNQNYMNLANIQTANLDNILVDKLTQGAYVERRSVLSNHNLVDEWTAPTAALRLGKFFPRGCRGFITDIEVYCRDQAAAGGTITVYIAPQMGMAPLASANVTVPAAGTEAYRTATFDKFWNYDSLFVWFVCSVGDINYARSTTEPFDEYYSTDSGATWIETYKRALVRVIYAGETAGDLPVSGIINNIEVPSNSDTEINDSWLGVSAGEETITSISGAGSCEYLLLYCSAATGAHLNVFNVYCDGKKAFANQFDFLNSRGVTSSTPKVSLLDYNVDGHNAMLLSVKFSFKRLFEIKVDFFDHVNAQGAYARGTVNLIT